MAKMTIHKQLEISKMDKTNKMMQFLILLESIDLHLADISQTLKMMQNDDAEKEKSSKKEKDKLYELLGGIIGGDKIGGLRGKEKGGKKGGEFCDDSSESKPKENGNALKDYSDSTKNSVEKFNGIIKRHLTQQEIGYIESRQQMIHAFRAYEKLNKLGFDDGAIQQALHNAFNDGFWHKHIRHFKALANTSKNGSLVIVNLLKINAGNTKVTAPVMAQYRG